MKRKGTGKVMTVMLVAVCAWVVIVAFVIKPDNIWDGVSLSVCGGATAALVTVPLTIKWWLNS